MKFSVITLFPELIETYMSASIMGRACQAGVISVEAINPRDFTLDPHRKVDDTPYGGGSGMVLSCQPMEAAYDSLKPVAPKTKVLLTAPTGHTFTHQNAVTWAEYDQVVLFCGHYEGFDERIKDVIPEIEEVSIGDFVLTGGELPALCIIDAITRMIPGAVQKADSVTEDSFYTGILDHPHYTRPPLYKDIPVPDILLSGNHAAIAKWRREQALQRTRENRPDLLEKVSLSASDSAFLESL